ncbi:MAG: putative glycosyltransferase, exosortase G system-associated [Lachnospiraceae bacterium]|nr:putative glycosyltransferase, exosortase G system-associated [Lachnospiraceae bacterium]
MGIIERFVNSFVFWAAWIIIPFIMEILPAFGSVFVLVKRLLFEKKAPKPIIYPEISIIVPVYNSKDTLRACIKSINDSEYPNEKIRLYLVNNRSSDDSFSVYTACQKEYPDLLMQWLNAEQGKSRALNLALYNSVGKYIIHIDSDGILEKSALTNMVDKFESDTKINVVTGAIMIQPELVEAYPKGKSRLLRKMEFMEYAQAFLAGRNCASDLNSIYTLSGAFSAFRKSAILKSRLYSTDTLAEDTQITFQMRYLQNERIYMSENSIFFVDPIENVDKLYTQRQRWQRGSLEVSKMFGGAKMKTRQMFSDVSVKTLMYDHTFAFPRIIWYLALICLMAVGYSVKTVVLATAFLFGMYILCGFMYFGSTIGFLKDFPEVKKYYKKQWWVVFLLPFFNFVVFFIRFAGIINSINTDSAWKTVTLSEEGKHFRQTVKNDFRHIHSGIVKLRKLVNEKEEIQENEEI